MNRYFTLCSTDYLALGGGNHFALYLDGDLWEFYSLSLNFFYKILMILIEICLILFSTYCYIFYFFLFKVNWFKFSLGNLWKPLFGAHWRFWSEGNRGAQIASSLSLSPLPLYLSHKHMHIWYYSCKCQLLSWVW